MGKEFATTAARWMHLEGVPAAPRIVAICDPDSNARDWFTRNIPGLELSTSNLAEMLPQVDAVYAAVPHHLHEDVYLQVLTAEKHLFAEKPFGIDLAAAHRIMAEVERRPKLKVAVSSEFPYFPGVQRMIRMAESGDFGVVFEVRAAFCHSSDLNPSKPINWKRQSQFNGTYGCMGDLGLHVCHVPFRLGFQPKNVRAILQNIVKSRPDAHGELTACDTWDNASLLCETVTGATLLLETKRISPGDLNSWSLEIYGTKASAKFTTKNPKTLRTLRDTGSSQSWMETDLGQPVSYRPVTGPIFEFGFSDAMLQMWANYLALIAGHEPEFPNATPEEAVLSHKLFTAAEKSYAKQMVCEL
jgi:predicted dehydrogenase